MKICSNCGNRSPDDAIFCDQCGARLEPQAAAAAPATPAQPPPGAQPSPGPTAAPPTAASQAAPAPSRPEPGRCPNCGAMNTPGEMYCSECGTELAAPEPEEDAEVPVPDAEQQAWAVGEANCAFCGAPLGPDDEFCHACGAQRAVAEPRAAAPEAPAPEAPVAEPEAEAPETEAQAPAEPEAAAPAQAVAAAQDEPERPVGAAPPVVEAPPAEAPPAPEPEPQVLECPACGAEYSPGDAFCQFCGAALVGAAAARPAAPEAAPAPTPQPTPAAAPRPEPEAAPAPGPQPRLVVAEGGAEIPLGGGGQIVVGREDPYTGIYPDVDLTPYGAEQAGVSRRHFRIARRGEGYTIEDLNSTNYTRVNRQQLQPGNPVQISDGDEIRAGRLRLTFRAS